MTTMSDVLVDKINNMISDMERDVESIITHHVKSQAELLFEHIPFKRIVFVGYTPTFNDGEECLHVDEVGYKDFSVCPHRNRMTYPDCLDFDGIFREVCGKELADEYADGYSYSNHLMSTNTTDSLFDHNNQQLNHVWNLLTKCISRTLRIGMNTNFKAIVSADDFGDISCVIHKINPDEWYNETSPRI